MCGTESDCNCVLGKHCLVKQFSMHSVTERYTIRFVAKQIVFNKEL